MGLDCAMTLDQIKDGASNTLLLAELRAGLISSDPRGVWALGGTSSSLWGHGWQGNDNGPNCPVSGDQTFNCSQVQTQFVGGSIAMIKVGMPCSPGSPDMNQVQTAQHARGRSSDRVLRRQRSFHQQLYSIRYFRHGTGHLGHAEFVQRWAIDPGRLVLTSTCGQLIVDAALPSSLPLRPHDATAE